MTRFSEITAATVLLLVLITSATFAADVDARPVDQITISSLDLYNYSMWLYSQKDYQRAVGELKRCVFFSRDTGLQERAVFMIGSSYQGSQAWSRAIQGYKDYLTAYPEGAFRENARFRLAQCAFGAQDYTQTRKYLDEQLEEFPTGKYADDATFVMALSYLLGRDWKRAGRVWRTFPLQHPDSPLLEGASIMAAGCDKLRLMPRKSAGKALLMSGIIPGTGQIYAGNHGDGWMSLLLNAAIIGFTVNRFDRDDDTAGVILALIGASFYTGNLYGAANAVRNKNQAKEAALVRSTLGKSKPTIEALLGHSRELMLPPG